MDVLDHITRQRPGTDGIRRSRWAVIRNTYPELKTTTIATWHQLVSPQVGRWVDQGPPTHHLTGPDLDAEVMFLALDSPSDVKKLLSLELTGAWINETREVPKAVLDTLTGRVGRWPAKAMGGPSWFGVIMDTNPPDDDHWWYRLAEKDRPDGFEFFAQPSGLSPEAENRENLPDGYYQRLLAGKAEEWVKVYVHGEYGFVQEGRPVHPSYRDSLHCRAFEAAPGWPWFVGIDFGLTPAAVIFQRGPTGTYRVRWELPTEHMGAKRFGALLAQFLAEKGIESVVKYTGDPAGGAESQSDESTPFQMLKAGGGIVAAPAPTNDWTVRREALDGALGRLVDGEPGILIHPDCAMLRKGLAGRYAYKRVQVAGDERFHDKPDKNMYSHIVEALHYGLLGAGEGSVALGRQRRDRGRRERGITEYSEFG